MIKILFTKLGEKLGEKFVDYGSHATRSMRDFRSMLKSSERKLKALSAKASDVLKEIKIKELSGDRKRKREVENWLKEVRIISREFHELVNGIDDEGFIIRFFGSDRATELSKSIDRLVEQSQHFTDLVLDVSKTKGHPLLVTKLVGEEFEKNLDRIWNFLMIDKFQIIGIYGMGGVGKTTLVKHIHNNLCEKTRDHLYFIQVSEVFTIQKLQDDIAKVVGFHLSEESNEDVRAATISRALSRRKNFSLILDDVRNTIDLEKLGDPLRVDGCKLIITTRSLDVCRQMGCRKIIEVKKLPEDEAWNLFNKTLGQEMTFTPQVQEIAMSVAKECGGLPLDLITMAGSMRGVSDIHAWIDALGALKQPMGQNEMEEKAMQVLKYSFDRLDQYNERERKIDGYTSLQHCFLYCSLYGPEGRKISRADLVNHFIREELIDKRDSRQAEFDQGYAILDKLINVCLLEIADGGKCVKMHDLVRDMALKITQNSPKFMAKSRISSNGILNDEEWPKDLNKMSLMGKGISEIPPGMTPNCPNLSTLLLFNNPLKFIPDSFFSRMCGLGVLNLGHTCLEVLPSSLSDLESLRALILTNCRNLKTVPNLGKLKALRELDLAKTAIHEVPLGMKNLVNLRYLSLARTKIEELPTGLLSGFSHLQCLFLSDTRIVVSYEELGSLENLEEFSGSFKRGV